MSKQLCSVFSKRLILEHTRNQALWDWILEFEMPLHWKPAIVHSVSLARFRVRLNLAIRYYIATVCLFEVAAAAKIQPLWGRVEKTNKAELGNRLTYRVLIYYFSQLRIFEVETPIWKKKWPYSSSWYRVSQCKLVYFILLWRVEICKLVLVWRWFGNSE